MFTTQAVRNLPTFRNPQQEPYCHLVAIIWNCKQNLPLRQILFSVFWSMLQVSEEGARRYSLFALKSIQGHKDLCPNGMQQLLFPLLWKIPGNSDFRKEGWFWLGLEEAELEAADHLASTIKKQNRRGEWGVGENRVGRAGEMLSSLCPFSSVWCCPRLDTAINLMWTVCHREVQSLLRDF